MSEKLQSVETYSLADARSRLALAEAHARSLLPRLGQLCALPSGADVLDVGAAQGRFVIACAKLGYRAVGVEPWPDALSIARQLAALEGVNVEVVPGTAEAIPFPSKRFDLVHAMSVIEHVRDAQAAFDEAFRILKPGGVFWFYTASSLCPRQREITGFPFFGWYPDRLKRRIMLWAKANRPHLIGHAETPALNWFTPRKARRMLRLAGFGRVCDRWELPCLPGTLRLKRCVYGLIGATFVTKFLADLVRPGCAYAAMKPSETDPGTVGGVQQGEAK